MSPSGGQSPPGPVPPDGSLPRPGDYSAPGKADEVASGTEVTPEATGPAQPPDDAVPFVPPPPPEPPPAPPIAAAAPVQRRDEPGAAAVPPEPAARPKKARAGRTLLIALAAGIVGAALVILALPAIFGVNPFDLMRGKATSGEATGGKTTSGSKTVMISPTQGATDVSGVARKVTPAVVNIDVRTGGSTDPFNATNPQSGTGSGVIYKSDGYIITNNHVVQDARTITVTLASGEELKGTRVGADPENDIAVVKVDKTGLPAAQLGDSDRLAVGELAVAVGSPLGFQQTVTSGVVSALHRVVGATDSGGTTTVLTDLIQTDASINEGNSGGALCDGAARLVGINTLIASQSGGSVGLGFAIPANTAVQVADDIIAHRPISHPYIGVLGQTVTAGVSAHYKLAVVEGAYVTQVIPGSPAAKAGIKPGDIIVAVDGKPVKSMDDMVAAVRSHGIGDEITVTYFQGTTKKTVSLTVGEKPSSVPAQ